MEEYTQAPEESIEDTSPFDKGINLKVAKQRVMESLSAAEQIRKKSADPALGWSHEELWYQESMVRYAVSTADKNQNANYYDPKLFAGIKRTTDRTTKGIFSSDDYFDLEPVNAKDQTDYQAAKAGKIVLSDQLHKAKYKQTIRGLIETAGFVDCAVAKVVPNNEKKTFKYRVPVNPMNPAAGFKVEEKEVQEYAVTHKEVELLNLYIEDLYVDDINDTNVTELVPSTMNYLKRAEELGIYGNVSKIKPCATSNEYVTDNFKTDERQAKEEVSNKTVKNVLLAEYWGECETDEGVRTVQITLAGDQVIRAKKVDFWHGKLPYVIHTNEKVPGLVTGMSPARRLLPSQFALNQLYNLEIENGMLKGSGAMLADERTAQYIRKQVPGGRWKRAQIAAVKLGSKDIRQQIMEVPFADVSRTCENVMDRITESMNVTLASPTSFSGQPTGTQLDRTAAGYSAAIGEANVGVEQMIYRAQDGLIEPTVTMTYQYLQEYLDENVTAQDHTGQWQTYSPADIYGLVNVRVYGGSRYLARMEKAAALQQSIEMLKGAPNSIQDIDFGMLYTRYLKYMGIEDPEQIMREKSPEQVFQELLQKAPPQKILEWAEMAVQQEQEMLRKKAIDEENYNKDRTIRTVNTDLAYNEALSKMTGQM